MAESSEDAGRTFDALNWARRELPYMAVATTGAKGLREAGDHGPSRRR
jgi:hypothetical protein